MSQTYTSAGTSINSKRLPAVYKKAPLSAPFVLDYGCGRYVDHIRDALHREGRELFPYDPYNQPDDVNKRTKDTIRLCLKHSIPVDVICSNVLNVIDDDFEVRQILHLITYIAEATGGTAYVTVYEGDRSGIGRKTGPDQYQRNQPLGHYLQFVERGKLQHGMIVIR